MLGVAKGTGALLLLMAFDPLIQFHVVTHSRHLPGREGKGGDKRGREGGRGRREGRLRRRRRGREERREGRRGREGKRGGTFK